MPERLGAGAGGVLGDSAAAGQLHPTRHSHDQLSAHQQPQPRGSAASALHWLRSTTSESAPRGVSTCISTVTKGMSGPLETVLTSAPRMTATMPRATATVTTTAATAAAATATERAAGGCGWGYSLNGLIDNLVCFLID